MTTHLPTLRQLQYLVAVADTLNFRRAAEALGVTQPSLSVQLKVLEDVLGTELAERGRSGVTLTPIGRDVSDRARRIIADVQSLSDIALGAADGLGVTLRFGAPPTLGPYLLPHVIKRLHKTYPSLRLYIREATPQELQKHLAEGDHDLIVTPLPVASEGLTVEQLFREPLYFVCAADHPLAGRAKVHAKDLKGAQILGLSQRYHLGEQIRDICRDLDAELLRDYEGTSLDTLRLMVGSGLGATFLPALYVSSEIGARGEVSVAQVTGAALHRTTGLVWRKSHARADGYRVIAETIKAAVRARFKDVLVL
jgi:LysR family hydrogen peroxide-inducible transcriptional activator